MDRHKIVCQFYQMQWVFMKVYHQLSLKLNNQEYKYKKFNSGLFKFLQHYDEENLKLIRNGQSHYNSDSSLQTINLVEQRSLLEMRPTIYILTFLSYASVHMLRMTYSFNKHNIKMQFGIGELFLGLIDAFIFFSLSIGTFFRYAIIKDNRHTFVCLKTAIPTALAFGIVPLVAYNMEDSPSAIPSFGTYVFLLSCMSLFGFSQFASFPLSLTIFSHHFNVKTQGSLVGIWSSKSNAGNIIGFFLANFMVYQLNMSWQSPMIFCVVIHIIISVLLYRFVPNNNPTGQKPTTSEQFFSFLRYKWSQPEFKLYILSFSCFKAILYSYQFWTPAFLVDCGYKEYSGYVPMMFDVSTLFGSFFMGKLYQQQHPNQQDEGKRPQSLIKKYKFFIASVVISLISFFYIIVPQSLILYFVLGISMGVFLGAVYNSLQNNQILHETQNDPRSTDMLATVNIGIGSCLVGIFQLIIGIVIWMGHKSQSTTNAPNQHNYEVVYVIIAIFGIVAMGLTFARVYFTQKNNQNNLKSIQLKLLNENLTQRLNIKTTTSTIDFY